MNTLPLITCWRLTTTYGLRPAPAFDRCGLSHHSRWPNHHHPRLHTAGCARFRACPGHAQRHGRTHDHLLSLGGGGRLVAGQPHAARLACGRTSPKCGEMGSGSRGRGLLALTPSLSRHPSPTLGRREERILLTFPGAMGKGLGDEAGLVKRWSVIANARR